MIDESKVIQFVVPANPPRLCTVLGVDVPMPDGELILRVGCGEIYLEVDCKTGQAKLVGADTNAAIEAVLHGVHLAISQNPYVERRDR